MMRFTQKGTSLLVDVSGSCSVVVDAIKFYARFNFIYCCCGLLRYLKDKITLYPPRPIYLTPLSTTSVLEGLGEEGLVQRGAETECRQKELAPVLMRLYCLVEFNF